MLTTMLGVSSVLTIIGFIGAYVIAKQKYNRWTENLFALAMTIVVGAGAVAVSCATMLVIEFLV